MFQLKIYGSGLLSKLLYSNRVILSLEMDDQSKIKFYYAILNLYIRSNDPSLSVWHSQCDESSIWPIVLLKLAYTCSKVFRLITKLSQYSQVVTPLDSKIILTE